MVAFKDGGEQLLKDFGTRDDVITDRSFPGLAGRQADGPVQVAQNRLAALADANGIPGIVGRGITPENVDDLTARIVCAAFTLDMETPELQALIEKVAQDGTAIQGNSEQQSRPAMVNVDLLEQRGLIRPEVLGVRHGTILDVNRVCRGWLEQIDRFTEVARIYEASANGLAREYQGVLDSLEHVQSGVPPEMHEQAIEKRQEVTARYVEAIKKLAEASGEFSNVIFRDQVDISPFDLADSLSAHIDSVRQLLQVSDELPLYAMRDVQALRNAADVLDIRVRQVSESGAYNDDKGPFYYGKLAAAQMYRILVPRTGELAPDSPFEGLLWDRDARVRVAAAQAAAAMEEEISELIRNPELVGPQRTAFYRVDQLLLAWSTVKTIVSDRLNVEKSGGRPPLHLDEEEILSGLYRKNL